MKPFPVGKTATEQGRELAADKHAKCLVLKINGDYLDSRIKNTKVELAEYDPALLILDPEVG